MNNTKLERHAMGLITKNWKKKIFHGPFITFLSVAVLMVAAKQARSEIVDGLLNYWSFEGNLQDNAHGLTGSASTVADNGFFDGVNGTDGIGFATGLFGIGIEQNGSAFNDRVNDGFVRVIRSADTLRGGQHVSISAWFQTAGFDHPYQTILAHGEGSQYRIARRLSSNVVSYAGGTADIPGSDIGPDISAGTGWHHVVAITVNGAFTEIWVDGTLVDTGLTPFIIDSGNNGAPGGSTPDLFIGANPQTGDNNREWWGKIDDVAIWNRQLQPEEIAEIFDAGTKGRSLLQQTPVITQVAPDSYNVTRGTYVSGGVFDLAESDNADLSVTRASSDVQSRTEFTIQAVSPVAFPASLEVTLEGSVFARSQVNQTIELLTIDGSGHQEWEQIDTRPATQFTDSTVTVVLNPAINLSRFIVDPLTMRIEARVRYQSVNPRQRFTSNTDQFIWTIGQ